MNWTEERPRENGYHWIRFRLSEEDDIRALIAWCGIHEKMNGDTLIGWYLCGTDEPLLDNKIINLSAKLEAPGPDVVYHVE